MLAFAEVEPAWARMRHCGVLPHPGRFRRHQKGRQCAWHRAAGGGAAGPGDIHRGPPEPVARPHPPVSGAGPSGIVDPRAGFRVNLSPALIRPRVPYRKLKIEGARRLVRRPPPLGQALRQRNAPRKALPTRAEDPCYRPSRRLQGSGPAESSHEDSVRENLARRRSAGARPGGTFCACGTKRTLHFQSHRRQRFRKKVFFARYETYQHCMPRRFSS